MERYPHFAPPYPLILKRLLAHPEKWAPTQRIHHLDHSHNYAELRQRVAKLAHLLRRLGVCPGDAVGVMDWDSHRYLEFFLAVPMCGAVLHTVNIRLSPEQVAYTIHHAEDVVLFVHRDFAPVVDQQRARFTAVREIVSLSDPSSPWTPADYEALLLNESDSYDFPELDENTVATTFYTTGTTGEPKGVFFTHRQLMLHTLSVGFGLAAFGDPFSFRQDDVYMPLTPMFHVHAWGLPYIATLLGVKQVYPGRFEIGKILRLLTEHGVTVSHGVPTVLHLLIAEARKTNTRLDGLKMLVGGSALTPGLCERAMERGIIVATGYGMSETCPILSVGNLKPTEGNRSKSAQVGIFTSTGFPMPLVETHIQGESGNFISKNSGDTGELVVRAPWLTPGYVSDPERSAELWRCGWLHTGDVAYQDEDGYLHITDRLKDVIKSGGEWVSSLELESLLGSHAWVSECAVVGMKDERWGEHPVSFVVLHPNADAATATRQLRDHLLGHVSRGCLQRWAVPDEIRIVSELPKTSVGKLNKRELRARLAAP